MQVGHDWNKSGNNYMTPSFYGATTITEIALSQKAALSGTMGNYFMYRYAYSCSSLETLAVPDTSGLTSVGDFFMSQYADSCSSLTLLILPKVGWFETNNVDWSVPSDRLGYLKGYVLDSGDLDDWKALTAVNKTLWLNYIRDEDDVIREPPTFAFNDTELTNYGLTVKSFRKPYNQQTGSLQLLNRAYPLATVKLASQAVIQAEIIAEDDDELLEYEDNIMLALVTHTDGKLEVAQYPDRYWMARLASPLEFIPIGLYQKAVNIVFDVFDPLAYANTATSSNHTIATDPDDLTETNGGTAPVRPTITITSNADHGETTV